MANADNVPAGTRADPGTRTADTADLTHTAWRDLAAHQRDDTGFCRICRDHWPCTPNAEALGALAAVSPRRP